VGLAHTGSAATNKRKPTIDYPRIETGSDTMLRIVEVEKDGGCCLSILFKLI
jgi:hypothetical protein